MTASVMVDSRSAAEIEASACGSKVRFGASGARHAAEGMRASGERVSPYRCPFCSCWHVGHPPSMDTVARLALIIRGLDS